MLAPKTLRLILGRSREGAWIEIRVATLISPIMDNGRSREGAWIEIIEQTKALVEK